MKKLFALILASIMCLSLVACGGNDAPAEEPAEDTATEETTDPAAETYNVGICQLVQHVALDAATQGFIDALNEALPGQVEFSNQNASNDIPMCSTIVNQFVSEEVDLILANATPALQAASAATIDIPILGTSITEYGVALEVNNSSLSASSFRPGCLENYRCMLPICMEYGVPIMVDSDAHDPTAVGDFTLATRLLEEIGFDEALILNNDLQKVKNFLLK